MRLNIREKAVYSKGLGPREQELMKEQGKGPKEEEVSGCRYKFPCRWRQFGGTYLGASVFLRGLQSLFVC